eukprot:gnl/TRDRNA2_/TRDRNA2_85540_c0_seq1.p1 gnl/TRDRNA2_/TRDRNA2_85540_c0~~gnl/TRDRNA2_/TRDRNA2_85540_c0_seq1.p1  ORF type:complete len:119 (+),score=19.33 gnl/TRDRNA2_/TRDRNA2_85540_c0_seq1:132-488(+)
MVVRLAAFVLLAALASVEAARGSLKLRKDDQVAAISLTTKSCMSVHDECVSRKAALCREFGVPMYHSDCMQVRSQLHAMTVPTATPLQNSCARGSVGSTSVCNLQCRRDATVTTGEVP